jgi:hypothetical protein
MDLTDSSAGRWASGDAGAGVFGDQAARAADAAARSRFRPPAGGSMAAPPPGGATGVGRRRTVPPKLYRIGEVAEYTGLSRQTIHNYTTMGLIREARWTRGGHRLYDEEVFGRLDEVAHLKAQRVPMERIREHFASMDVPEAAGARPGPA